MTIEKFQLCSNNSVCEGTFRVLRGRAPAQLRGNIDCKMHIIENIFVPTLRCKNLEYLTKETNSARTQIFAFRQQNIDN
jgi:hypothetical protein